MGDRGVFRQSRVDLRGVGRARLRESHDFMLDSEDRRDPDHPLSVGAVHENE